MAIADEAPKRRPFVLGLIILVHLLLGFMLFGPSGAGFGPRHRTSVVSGTGAALQPATATPEPPRRSFRFSFDRTGLVGPSTLPPPARITPSPRKVAPLPHPS